MGHYFDLTGLGMTFSSLLFSTLVYSYYRAPRDDLRVGQEVHRDAAPLAQEALAQGLSHMYMYMYIYIYIHMYVCNYVCMYVFSLSLYVYIYIYIYIYTYTHTTYQAIFTHSRVPHSPKAA